MKKVLKSVTLIAVTLSMFSCKKALDSVSPSEASTQSTTISDNNAARESSDDVSTDAVNAAEATNSGARLSGLSSSRIHLSVKLIIDADSVVRDTLLNTIQIYYGGTKMNYRGDTRKGIVTIAHTGIWGTVGSELIVTVNNLIITRGIDGKTVALTGVKSIQNYNGKKVVDLISGDTLIQKVRGALSITFDNGTSRNWIITRKRAISSSSITITGDTAVGALSNVAETGFTRGGYPFVHQITSPIIFELCGLKLRTFSGTDAITITDLSYSAGNYVTVQAGLDASGNTVSNVCLATSAKISWLSKLGVSESAIVTVNK